MDKNGKEKRKEWDKKYEAKRAGQRTRNWAVIFYPEDLPDGWQAMIDDLHLKWIEGPLHDKDYNADGSPKKPHHHTLFMFDAIKSAEQVFTIFSGLFGASESGSIVGVATPQQCNDRNATVRYMIHKDNPEKAQYDVADIVGHGGADPAEIMRYSATETIAMMVEMEEYIEEHGITELAAFSRAIRYNRPEWYTILATKQTRYFSDFIASCRHTRYKERKELDELLKVDPETGEVLE